jgi:hypothetical protein
MFFSSVLDMLSILPYQVCCPLNAIKNALQLSESESNSGSSYGKVGNSNTGPNSPNQTIQLFSSHPNFRFLPTFESCSSTSITDRVVGGKAAPHGSYSWLVRIGYKGTKLNWKYWLKELRQIF